MEEKRFFVTWMTTLAVFLLTVGLFCYFTDPFRLYWKKESTCQRNYHDMYPQIAKLAALGWQTPRVLLLGSSRVDLGLDQTSSQLASYQGRVVNLGINGEKIEHLFMHVQHADNLSEGALELVIVGLDFSPSGKQLTYPLDSSFFLLDQTWKIEYYCHLFQRTLFSYAALKSSIQEYFLPLEERESHVSLAKAWEQGEMLTLCQKVEEKTYENWQKKFDPHMYYQKLQSECQDLRTLIRTCRQKNARLLLFIHPYHVRLLEIIRQMGAWEFFEEWKRQLLAVVEEENSLKRGVPVELWDFSGYHQLAQSAFTNQELFPMYWEASHYRHVLGEMILAKLLQNDSSIPDSVPQDFGVKLNSLSLDTHFTHLRESRDLFCEQQGQRVHCRKIHEPCLYLDMPFRFSGKTEPLPRH